MTLLAAENGMWFQIGVFVHFALSILLLIVIFPQKEKGGGLAGAFGGTGSIATFGVQTADVVARFTWGLFAVWLCLGLGLAMAHNSDIEKPRDVTPKSAEAPETPPENKPN